MNPASFDIKDILDDTSSGQGFGTFGTDLFVAKEPDSPDFAITVYDNGGADPEPHYVEDRTNFQVRVRGARGGYATAYSKLHNIRAYLKTVANETWNGTRYIGIWAQGDVQFAGFDDNDRPAFTADFRTIRTE